MIPSSMAMRSKAAWAARFAAGPSGAAAARAPAVARGEGAAKRAYAEPTPDGRVKSDVVATRGGAFRMGAPATENGRTDDEGPQHPVTIRPFWMGKLEVSWDEYD